MIFKLNLNLHLQLFALRIAGSSSGQSNMSFGCSHRSHGVRAICAYCGLVIAVNFRIRRLIVYKLSKGAHVVPRIDIVMFVFLCAHSAQQIVSRDIAATLPLRVSRIASISSLKASKAELINTLAPRASL